MASIKLFGFTLGSKDVARDQLPEQPSFATPNDTLDDGAVTITQNAYYCSRKIHRIQSPDLCRQPQQAQSIRRHSRLL